MGSQRRRRRERTGLLRQYAEKDFSLTDATSFTVMERLELEQAFSFDSDFA
jgi:predicted nucleic acid-binding protein